MPNCMIGKRSRRLLRTFIMLITVLNSSSEEYAYTSAQDDPQLVYSSDPNDTWNRIFYHLFTRTVSYKLTDDFPNGAPFLKLEDMGFPDGLPVSTRLFERVEIGDRAIEPFYPSFITSAGLHEALSDKHFFQLKQALTDALTDKRVRPPLHRALMQADIWAAHDRLAPINQFSRTQTTELDERASQLLPLMARLIKKLALTSEEVKNLPDNYALATKEHRLPNLFSPYSEWIEVQWILSRLHVDAMDFRRAARVFVKPNIQLRDKQRFLDRLRDNLGDLKELGAVAIVIQNLLIDSEGNITPTRLTHEVQARTFKRDVNGKIVKTELSQYELSRKLLVTKPRTGGLILFAETAPMFLPAAGNDYGFATPQIDRQGETQPILATLRRRCGACHGWPHAPAILTFAIHIHAPDSIPSVKLLEQPNDEYACYVAAQKVNRREFKLLQTEWK